MVMELMARRFSDQELSDMHDELKGLSIRLDKHEREEKEKFIAMINAVNQNTASIDKLTEETRAIVDLHRDLQATARVGKSLQNFLLWLLKWGAIGSAIAAAIKWLIDSPYP